MSIVRLRVRLSLGLRLRLGLSKPIRSRAKLSLVLVLVLVDLLAPLLILLELLVDALRYRAVQAGRERIRQRGLTEQGHR